jgi:E3 ubiquitin-protein ligase UHRF1
VSPTNRTARLTPSVDLGEAFTYTGSGGRDLKGTKQNPKNLRSAPQTSHQSFDNPLNAALKVSPMAGDR